jgi:hypothetical protein
MALGMPINLTVSPHFYYQAAQWPCNNAINMLANTELLDKSHGSAKLLAGYSLSKKYKRIMKKF